MSPRDGGLPQETFGKSGCQTGAIVLKFQILSRRCADAPEFLQDDTPLLHPNDMKEILIFLLAAFALSACDRSGVSRAERAAIKIYAADTRALHEWMEKNKPDEGNPAAFLAIMDESQTRMRAIKTAGLPTDLKAAFEKTVASAEKIFDLFREVPRDDAGFVEYFREKAKSDPGFKENFEKAFGDAQKEGDEANAELTVVSGKYGITVNVGASDKK